MRFSRHARYIDALIELSSDVSENISVGATWMIKQSLENGALFSRSQCLQLARKLEALTTWDAQLHVCQSIQYLQICKSEAGQFADWLIPLCAHDRAFLRAWAMDGLVRIARIDDTLASEAGGWLKRAKNDPAASVRARARRLEAEFKRQV